MASETIYTCDKCKQRVLGYENLYKMSLSIRLNNNGRVATATKEVCDVCLGEFGFENKSDDNYVSNYSTVGRRIFDMVNKFFKRS